MCLCVCASSHCACACVFVYRCVRGIAVYVQSTGLACNFMNQFILLCVCVEFEIKQILNTRKMHIQ